METNNSQLVIYQAPDGKMSIDVTVQNETVWLSQAQMAELFGKDQSVIARHISNIFKEGELEKGGNMQILHITFSKYKPTQIYSLDVIISVGYRVKSKRGTQFRIWANKILKQYLLQGYAVNERIASQKYDELSQLVKVAGRTIQNQEKLTDDSRSLLDVVVDYTYALDPLDRYDYQQLQIEDTTDNEAFHAIYDNAMEVIRELHEKFGHKPKIPSMLSVTPYSHTYRQSPGSWLVSHRKTPVRPYHHHSSYYPSPRHASED